MQQRYEVYGLRVQANRPIPGAVCASTSPAADVQVWLGGLPPWLVDALPTARLWRSGPFGEEHGEPTLRVWQVLQGRYFRFRYADGTEFLIDRGGSRVWGAWPPEFTLEDAATYLLGPILGFVLLLRGVICLHASAVAVGGKAIAFLGPAGAGKSTTAAALSSLGYPVLAEDVLAMADRGNAFDVQPGSPCVRLWPASVCMLFGSPEALPRLTPNWEKRCLDLSRRGYPLQRQPLPLAAVYLLGVRRSEVAAPFVEGVSEQASLMAMLGNTYVAYLMDRAAGARQFELLGRVADTVPLRRVTPQADPSGLSRLCDVILRDYHQFCA